MNQTEPRWDTSTKRIVLLTLLLLIALFIYRFRAVLPPLILAFLLAFIIDPVVDFLEQRTMLSRTAATLIVFAVIILTLAAAPAVAVPTIVREIRRLNLDFAQILADLEQLIAQPVEIFGRELDLREVYQQVQTTLERYVSQVAAGTVDVVFGFASTVFWLIFILLSAFYMVRDADRIVEGIDALMPPVMRGDFVQLRIKITQVWHAFLRGQLLMGLIMVVITTVATLIIGLPNALALGILAGVTEFIPNIGPVIAAIPAVAVGFFEGSTWIPLEGFWFAVLVLGVYILIQQIEGNLLLPRVMGRSLNLHPLVVLVAIIAGGSLAGILGMLLAAPSVATLRVLMDYIYRRLTDQDPFPEEESESKEPRSGIGRWLWNRARRRALADQWVVRPARMGDRSDVEMLCAQIWDGDDYVPKVWDEWLEDPHGQLTVVELKGRVVAVSKLTRLAEDEWWLEGLRVAPEYRRLGLAQLLQDYQVSLAEQVGHGVVRFGTASHNRPVRKNAARNGFRRVGRFVFYSAKSLPGPCPLCPLTFDDVGAAWQLIESSPILAAAGGLYEVRWHWLEMTRDRLADHIREEQVWGVRSGGELAALAIAQEDAERGRLSVGYLDGGEEGVTTLLWGLRVAAGERGLEELRLRVVSQPSLLKPIEATGGTRAWDDAIWIFERPLRGEADSTPSTPAPAVSEEPVDEE
ncbi:MAG: AI-2E family transporter [Anaerolineae bacterium]|jgi:predicted PurR-regulated permease PerM/GNAT superfamily N-acetyltransferase